VGEDIEGGRNKEEGLGDGERSEEKNGRVEMRGRNRKEKNRK
jgi:hypothetical protein